MGTVSGKNRVRSLELYKYTTGKEEVVKSNRYAHERLAGEHQKERITYAQATPSAVRGPLLAPDAAALHPTPDDDIIIPVDGRNRRVLVIANTQNMYMRVPYFRVLQDMMEDIAAFIDQNIDQLDSIVVFRNARCPPLRCLLDTNIREALERWERRAGKPGRQIIWQLWDVQDRVNDQVTPHESNPRTGAAGERVLAFIGAHGYAYVCGLWRSHLLESVVRPLCSLAPGSVRTNIRLLWECTVDRTKDDWDRSQRMITQWNIGCSAARIAIMCAGEATTELQGGVVDRPEECKRKRPRNEDWD